MKDGILLEFLKPIFNSCAHSISYLADRVLELEKKVDELEKGKEVQS
jgi:hypothetical protein